MVEPEKDISRKENNFLIRQCFYNKLMKNSPKYSIFTEAQIMKITDPQNLFDNRKGTLTDYVALVHAQMGLFYDPNKSKKFQSRIYTVFNHYEINAWPKYMKNVNRIQDIYLKMEHEDRKMNLRVDYSNPTHIRV